MNRSRLSILFALLLSLNIVAIAGAQPPSPAAPFGTAFTYQGRLRSSNKPFNGSCDFQFSLWNALSGGAQIGTTQSANNLAVADGRFNAQLDFGAAFDGNGRWLQVAVRCPAGSGIFIALAPRQAVAPSPYAVRATAAGTAGSVPWSGITGKPAGFADDVDNTVTVPLNLIGSSANPILVAANSGEGRAGEFSNTGTTAALAGTSSGSGGTGVYGEANNGTNAYGVWGSSTSGLGVIGETTSGFGVAGLSTSNTGVYGESGSGVAVRGVSTSNIGVYGSSTSGHGVRGVGTSGIGVYGTSTTGAGMRGDSTSGYGMFGVSFGSVNTAGTIGVYGPAGTFTYYTAGVVGSTTIPGGTGTSGFSPTGVGVRGVSTSGFAGYFQGDVQITGSLSAAGTKMFKIDHPLDPANKYLQHASIESSEMKNLYDGVATIGADGTAAVTLPDWFEALNQDFRYQLTCIGGFAQVYIAQEIKGNRFVIGGGKPGMKVSWQVTGLRHDPWAAQHPLQVEVTKSTTERGKYLYPRGYGQPETQSVDSIQAAQGNQSQSTVAAPTQPVAPKSLRSERASKRP